MGSQSSYPWKGEEDPYFYPAGTTSYWGSTSIIGHVELSYNNSSCAPGTLIANSGGNVTLQYGQGVFAEGGTPYPLPNNVQFVVTWWEYHTATKQYADWGNLCSVLQ